jgi:RNA polymerase sigma factor (sigma-70 family)
MAAHPHSGSRDALANGKLSAEASRFYASVYSSARKGSLAELRRKGCSEEEAEEFFATAFEKVMGTVDPVARGFSAPEMVNFIKRAAWRVMLDERRRRGQRQEIELSAIQSLTDAAAESPDEVAVEREAVAIGREALQMLSERDRLIFRQRHQLDLSPEEILQRTPGLSLRTYRKIIQRANNRVLAAFARIEGGERCEEMESSLLRRYIADQCPEPEQLAVEIHLAHCRACQMAHARMRGYLLDVASGIAVVATGATSNRLGVLGLPLRLLDAASNGANGMVEATRAARERIRDLVLRIAGSAPGAGGDATVGQALTATSVKVASVCAAGVAAGACVAAGVVPGIGEIGLLGSHGDQANPPAKTSPHVHQTKAPPTLIDPLPQSEPTSASPEKHETKRARGSAGESENHTASTTTAPSESASSSPAKESKKVTSGEFGAESGQPVTHPSSSPPPSSPPSSGSSGSGSGASPSQGGSSSGKGGGEFGL